MILSQTVSNIFKINHHLYLVYGESYVLKQWSSWAKLNRAAKITSVFGDPLEFLKERNLKFMLNFKNASGEIVMTEKDNGQLEIHDELLKESLENNLELEEAKKKVAHDDEV